MNLITILEDSIDRKYQKEWYIFLSVQKFLVEKYCDWLSLFIDLDSKALIGRGDLKIGKKHYTIVLTYSPFHAGSGRYDKIFLSSENIEYNNKIHVYGNLSLCLYHPFIDQGLFQRIPLFKMIPWISEWIIFYEQWKTYGVWFGKEIKH